jgi:thiol-disulfide isomerase/thioredoxin
MKHIYAFVAALLIGTSAFAQLPDGSVAPDWTATDLDGTEWNLQELLDAGKTVIIDFSATWCGPCWNYHNTHILRDLHDTFGPEGTDNLMVFYIEGDAATTIDDLHGTGPSTVGDWVTGTTYPIIDDADESIFSAYACTYYPTIYTICPDGILVESGQSTFDAHVGMAFGDCENAITGAAPLVDYVGDFVACSDGWNALVDMTNMGSENVTSATFSVTVGGVAQPDVEWTGDLATGATTQVDCGDYTATGDVEIELNMVNGSSWSSTASLTVAAAAEGTSLIKVSILTDNWGEETSWEVLGSDGTVYGSVAEGTLADLTAYEWWVSVPSTGCYSFKVYDAYGDGLYGSQWPGGSNGTVTVETYDDNIELASTIWTYTGDYNFAEDAAGMEITSVNVGVEEVSVASSMEVYPNPVINNATIDFNLPASAAAAITVYNLVGAQVMNVNLGTLPAGEQRQVLDMSNLEAGVYMVAVQAAGEVNTLRITKK